MRTFGWSMAFSLAFWLGWAMGYKMGVTDEREEWERPDGVGVLPG